MKAIFESENNQEIKRISKADDMASFIWELKHNILFECDDFEALVEKINANLKAHNINIDDLWE